MSAIRVVRRFFPVHRLIVTAFVAYLSYLFMGQVRKSEWVTEEGQIVRLPSEADSSAAVAKIAVGWFLFTSIGSWGLGSADPVGPALWSLLGGFVGAGIGHRRIARQRTGDGMILVRSADEIDP